MAGDEFGERTEQPTERRRQDARQKGNVTRSTDLNSAGLMLAAAAAIYMFGVSLPQAMAELLHSQLKGPAWRGIDAASTMKHFWVIVEFVAAVLLPLFLLMVAAALLFNTVQIGFLLAPESLQPKFSRLNPLEGVKRILSMRGLVKLGVSLTKLILLAAITAWVIASMLPHFLPIIDVKWMSDVASLSGDAFRNTGLAKIILLAIKDSLTSLAFQLALTLIVLALLDFAFQKWKHEQDLRMTKQEIREELKNMDGDPLTRQRRRDAHRKLAQARELRQVREADVVITNPTEIAIALKYDPDQMPAPTVVAKGMGPIAARIRQIAAENGIPIIERKPLAQALYRTIKVGQTIPVEMYEVFIEIMAYIYRLTGRTHPNLT